MKLKREFLVGVGSRVRFWEDGWCGPNPLCNTFPLPFSLADSKGAKVAEVWGTLGKEGGWNPRFGDGSGTGVHQHYSK